LNGENQALMLQTSHWTHGKFFQFTRMAKMADLGSVSEFPVSARNPSELPGRFRVRARARRMAGRGWEGDSPLATYRGKHAWNAA
jgi:hypothetical protein